jgi:ABC-type uncharacterized transport system involved in gliding motility auxiliary subunit
MEKVKKPFFRLEPIMMISAAIVIFVAVNIIMNATLGGRRFDLTSNGIYTLSDGTRNILKKLDEPVRIRFFYTEKNATGIPYIHSYAERIKGLLKQYANLSNGLLELEFINPEPFSKQEDTAVAFGIQNVPLNDMGNNLYFGLVASNSTGDSKTIPFLNPERESFLEYDLTRILYDLTTLKKPVIGLLSWIETKTPSYDFSENNADWVVIDQIKEQFDVRLLEKNIDFIPNDIDTLMLIHPSDVHEDTRYAIDQFVLKGGKALIFVDSYSEMRDNDNPREVSDLKQLFAAWGIAFDGSKVVLDTANSLRVRISGADSRLHTIDKPNWLSLDNQHLNHQDVVTAELGQIRYISGGHFVSIDENISLTPLLQTSKNSMEVINNQLSDPVKLIQEFMPSDQQFILAGRIRGMAKTAFPTRNTKGHIAESHDPINIIVVADTDFLRDQFWVQKQNFLGHPILMQMADNGAFVSNALENLSGSSDLIGLRSRSHVERPFQVVQNLRRNAEARFLQEEQQLQDRLREAERRFAELQNGQNSAQGSVFLTSDQEKEIEKFRQEMINTRKQLREVQHSLRKDIERLGSVFKFIHIGLIPFLIIIIGLYVPRHMGIRRV